MTPKKNHTLSQAERQATIYALLQEKMRLAIRHTLISVLEEEVENFVQAALYQRKPSRKDYRNGYYERNLVTTIGEIEDLTVTRTCGGFHTELFERYQRRRAELDESICDIFVKGVSTTGVGEIIEALTDTHPSPSTVSRVFHSLEEEFTGWKQRQLQAHYLYVFADGTSFTVIYDENGCKMPILVEEDGKRDVLAFTMGERENQKAWKTCWTTSRSGACKGSICGLPMATRPCSRRSI
jgi:putative transposase